MTSVYFDNAATTNIRPEVVDAMSDVLKNSFGNPSSTHSYGRSSKSLIEESRKSIAAHFNALPSEIVFTSGGTEADNLALRSAVRDLGIKHIITSRIEHHAVLHMAEQLQLEYDVEISYVNLIDNGAIDLSHLEELLKQSDPSIVSLMHVNNEIGNLLDFQTVADLCKKYDALFHSDCVQSVGHFPIDVSKTPIDFFAASAHKFHGPKGVGFAYIRKDSGLKPLIFGGEQERGYRAGTESTHNIVGLDRSLAMAYEHLDKEQKYITALKSRFISKAQELIPGIGFNGLSGDLDKSTYTLVSVRLPIPPEKSGMLLFQLDLKGIACSKGSACQSGSTQSSHVLSEILSEEQLQQPSIRFSFSCYNTEEEVDYVVETLAELVNA